MTRLSMLTACSSRYLWCVDVTPRRRRLSLSGDGELVALTASASHRRILARCRDVGVFSGWSADLASTSSRLSTVRGACRRRRFLVTCCVTVVFMVGFGDPFAVPRESLVPPEIMTMVAERHTSSCWCGNECIRRTSTMARWCILIARSNGTCALEDPRVLHRDHHPIPIGDRDDTSDLRTGSSPRCAGSALSWS